MSDKSTRILIVDDSQVIRSLLTDYLTDLGYVVEVAVNGQEGIDAALAGDFQLVFCDLHMPKKNGYQVFTEVIKVKPSLRFIMTDSLPDELAAMAAEAGACGCLTKPFDLSEISAKVTEVLETVEKECLAKVK
jgi:two-component system alkaline phosphatase synthesis response regulator PhoP